MLFTSPHVQLGVKMATSSWNALTLQEKLEVSKKHPKDSARQLAEELSCGRTEIKGILKNKDSLVIFWRQCTIVKEKSQDL